MTGTSQIVRNRRPPASAGGPLRAALFLPLALGICGALVARRLGARLTFAPEDWALIGEDAYTWVAESVETAIWVFFNLATPLT